MFSCSLSSRKIQIDKVLVGEQFGMKQANLLCQWLTCNLGVNNAQSNGNRIYSSGKMRRHNTSILNILWINMQRWEQPICANKIRYQCNTISVLKAFFLHISTNSFICSSKLLSSKSVSCIKVIWLVFNAHEIELQFTSQFCKFYYNALNGNTYFYSFFYQLHYTIPKNTQ